MPKAIFWDNDGVLVATEHLFFAATRGVLAEAGVELDRDSFVRISLQQGKSAFELAREHGLNDALIEEMRQERDTRYCLLLESHSQALPGVEQVLQSLHGRFVMGIVTSSLKIHFDIIHRTTGLLKYFDFVLTRENFFHTKPHPEPYLNALNTCQLDPTEALVVEDSERGLKSALAAGVRCCVIPGELNSGCDFSGAAAILDQVADLPAFVQRF